MTIKSSGFLRFSEIQSEFGGANPISISEYYRGMLVPNGPDQNAIVTVSGIINLGKFYNTVKAFALNRTLSTNTANYNVLKYRYRRMWKFDSETSYKRFSIGLSARYYSFMENIDKVFEGVIPGVKTYRAGHRSGDWVFDANLTFKARKNMRLGIVVKNAFNHEYMTRPADLQPPRSFVVQCMINL